MLLSFLRHFLILLSCSFNKCSISKENTDTIGRAVIEFTQIQPLKSSHKTERKKEIITSYRDRKEVLNNKANIKEGMDGQLGVLKAVKPNSKIKYSRTSHKRPHNTRI